MDKLSDKKSIILGINNAEKEVWINLYIYQLYSYYITDKIYLISKWYHMKKYILSIDLYLL